MSNLREHAERELAAFGDIDMVNDAVLALIDVFAAQGHSGSSAPHVAALFHKLAAFEPLCPLTGEDSEWCEVSPGVFQNIRCSHVFKENGEAYDIDGRIFREPNGCCYTSAESHVPVTFPYVPKSEYVDVPASADQ